MRCHPRDPGCKPEDGFDMGVIPLVITAEAGGMAIGDLVLIVAAMVAPALLAAVASGEEIDWTDLVADVGRRLFENGVLPGSKKSADGERVYDNELADGMIGDDGAVTMDVPRDSIIVGPQTDAETWYVVYKDPRFPDEWFQFGSGGNEAHADALLSSLKSELINGKPLECKKISSSNSSRQGCVESAE